MDMESDAALMMSIASGSGGYCSRSSSKATEWGELDVEALLI
jgi:hypothetical protein